MGVLIGKGLANMVVGPQSVVYRVKDSPSTPVADELVILNLAKSDYVSLDRIGTRIWDVLEKPHRVDELCRSLEDKFSGDSGKIASDVLRFLNELAAEGLVHVSDS